MKKSEKTSIVDTMKEVSQDYDDEDICFEVLKKIYDHISDHGNERDEDRANKMKNIIELELVEKKKS